MEKKICYQEFRTHKRKNGKEKLLLGIQDTQTEKWKKRYQEFRTHKQKNGKEKQFLGIQDTQTEIMEKKNRYQE